MPSISTGSDLLCDRSNALRTKRLIYHDLIVFIIIATFGVIAGFAVNLLRDKPLSLTYVGKEERLQKSVSKLTASTTAPPTSSASSLPETLSLDEFFSFVQERRGVVLDARPEIFHRLGHIPSALSLPRDDFEAAFSQMKAQLSPDAPIVVYCSNASCEDSDLVAKSLRALGYTKISVFKGGWDEWTAAGHPEVTN